MPKTSRKVGRPTKYKPEYCDKIIEYFNQPLYITVEVEKMSASGAVKVVKERVANDMPTLEGFALDICGVAPDKLSKWAEANEDFRQAITAAKGYQKKFLFNHSMKGNYNASFSKFFAINCLGMKDSSHVETDNTHKVEGYGLAFDLSKHPDEL